MSDLEDVRLNRIENKLDNLSAAISSLAVVDARLTDYISESSKLSSRLAELEKYVTTQALKQAEMKVSLSAIIRIMWIIGGTVAGMLATAILKGTTL